LSAWAASTLASDLPRRKFVRRVCARKQTVRPRSTAMGLALPRLDELGDLGADVAIRDVADHTIRERRVIDGISKAASVRKHLPRVGKTISCSDSRQHL
jgi:hypothetical protein